ncbi:MAG: ABC transporter [Chloroflexi bacterium]|nr:MAG: ABC transporter [Chloroflexota bacterium]
MIVAVVALIVLRGVLEFCRDEVAHGAAARLKVQLRERIYRHVLRLGAGHFDQRRTGDAVLAQVEGVEQLDTFFGRYIPQMIVAAVTPVIIFGFVAVLDLRTALVYLGAALFTLLAPAMFHRANERGSLARRTEYSALGADFLDSMQGLATLKVFGQSGRRGRQLAERSKAVFHSSMRMLTINIGSIGVTMFGVSAGSALALGWGALRVRDGSLETTTLFVVLLLGVEVFRPLRELTNLFHQGMLASAAARSIYDILDSPVEVLERPGSQVAGSLSPQVAFDDVHFGYESGRRPALRGCSFTLAPGETLGVVGASGAGKSTLVSLLLRFVDPTAGRITFGGYDLRDLPLEVLRRNIAVVTQDTYLFHGTVAENLRLGKPDATLEELRAAARLANADDFISALPQGYDTVVGERGSRLSGGQRQRIAIARALLKDAPLLVLDEALSSVDAENEAIIQEALDRLRRGRTTLVIAHRLSSVIDADRILVLERGEVVEVGTHAQLLARDGVYARLMAAQRDADAEAAPAEVVSGLGAARYEPASPEQSGDGAAGGALPLVPANIGLVPLFRRLFALVRPWRGELVVVVLAGLLHAAAVVGLAVVSALVVGRVVTGGEIGGLLWVLAALVPANALFAWLDVWLAHDLAYRLLAEMRVRLYGLLDRLAPAYMLRRRSGDLLSAATGDIELIELFYAHTLVPAMLAVVVPGAVLLVLGGLHGLLALVLVPFLLAVALTPLLGVRRLERLGNDLRFQTGEANAHMVDSLQGLRTIAAFDYGAARTAEIRAHGATIGNTKRRFQRQQSLQAGLIEGLTALGGLAVLSTGAWLVTDGALARVNLPLATVLALSAFGPVASIAVVGKELMETVAAGRRYFAVEDTPPPVSDGPGVTLEHATHGLPVAFEGVTFRYGRADRPALEQVSFTLAAGETVALVGGSGAGKSTAAHLLLRYWDPEEGRITLAGHDLRDFTLDDLRARIAIVSQDTYLFHTTLWENLKLGRPDATDDEVYAAARLANVAEFVEHLPDGYQTLVGERGLQLSGGQRQRVAIARALLKDAPVLILDEATSHLDTVNELEVRQALQRLQRGRTTLVIAHRLSTIRAADQIIVLDAGRVVERGTHQQLLALDGAYSRLIAAQLRGFTRRPAPEEDVVVHD